MIAQTSENKTVSQNLQILSFELDGDWFGIAIATIQEVLEYRNVTKVPRTPDFMMGVINLRGKVIPVVDLRRQFSMQVSQPKIDTCIIIVHVEIDNEHTVLGVLADRVQEVVEIPLVDINPAPKMGNKIDNAFIEGIAKHEDDFIILLKTERVFSIEEFETIEASQAALDDSADANILDSGLDKTALDSGATQPA